MSGGSGSILGVEDRDNRLRLRASFLCGGESSVEEPLEEGHDRR